MKTTKLFLGAMAMAFGMQISVAQPPADRGQRGERGERPSPAQIFDKLDQNDDGKISFAEFEAMPKRGRDRNNNPQIDKQEVFDRIDADGNGYITLQEFEEGRPKRGEDVDRGQGREMSEEQKAKAKGKMKGKMKGMKKKLKEGRYQ